MPPRVLLDGTKLLDRRTDGVKRYVVELSRALALANSRDFVIDVALSADCVVPLPALAEKLDRGALLREFVPTLLIHDDRNPLVACQERVRNGSKQGLARARDTLELQAWKLARSGLRRWTELVERVAPRSTSYDLVHLTLPNTWGQVAGYSGRRLTTVHDLSHVACPHLQTPENNRSLAQGIALAQAAGSRFVAVSNATAGELIDRLSVANSLVDVVHQGADHRRFRAGHSPTDRGRVRRHYNLSGGRFLLSLGTIEPRKNLINVVRGFLHYIQRQPESEVRLVIGGYRGWGDHSELDDLIAGSPHVQAIGYLREEDLPTLYGMCEAFCYISHYEGFGLPLLEAMCCGAPVIFGDNSSMPEVVGPGGIGVSSHEPAAIAAAMQAVLHDSSRRSELSARALAQAAQFDWQRTAAETLAVYDRCLNVSVLRFPGKSEVPNVRAA